ncbi:MAG: hypothetical protein ACT4OG_10525 [Alphaproteobacteria bacterium]
MRRRELLEAALALGAMGAVPAVARASAPQKTMRRVRPGDPAWPKPEHWQALNRLVGSNLIKVDPLLEPCTTNLFGGNCFETIANVRNPFFLGDQPAGTQISGWLDAWSPPSPAPMPYARAMRPMSPQP